MLYMMAIRKKPHLVKDRGPRIDTTRFPIIKEYNDWPGLSELSGKWAGFKIRRRSDGLYSKGGGTPRFNKIGKVWATRNALHNHFAVIREYGKNVHEVYADCEVVFLIESIAPVPMEIYVSK